MKCSLIPELILFLKVAHFTWNLTKVEKDLTNKNRKNIINIAKKRD